jgi:hypothetical protein
MIARTPTTVPSDFTRFAAFSPSNTYFAAAASSFVFPGLVISSRYFGHIALIYPASANLLRQHGHSPSKPLTNAKNALGCGNVMMALNASGARCA